MITRCPEQVELERFLKGVFTSSVQKAAWNQHLLACTECRELSEMDQGLKAMFEELPSPELSGRFEFQLQAAVRRKQQAASKCRLKRLVLQGYWLAAFVLSYWILDGVTGSVQLSFDGTLKFLMAAFLGLSVLEFFIRRANLDLVELVLNTALDPRFSSSSVAADEGK